MNKVIISGRLTRDPEVRYSQSQVCIARYTLAVDRIVKRGEEKKTDFIQCVALGAKGEFAEKYFRKGMKIIVEGKWQTGSYVNQDGNKVNTNECLVDSQEFCEGKQSNQNAEQNTQPAPEPTPPHYTDGFMNIPEGIDEELPFS